MTGDSETADVFDFVDAYLADLERGEDRPLAHWLARFPRSQAAIAREWLALRHPAEPAADSARAEPGASAGDARDRLGPYRIVRELGRGGQGTVFLAEDSRLARRVALKVLTSRFEGVSDEKRQRFKREADVIAKLEHPGLCSIHDADLDGDSPWIAMRFVEGRTLAEGLAEARERGSADVFGLPLPPRTNVEVHAVLSFFERAARALHAAHEAGVVHRDVKPGNVIVALDGRPVLLDFGLARDETSETGTLTQSGDVFGTPAYMSPEQLTLSSGELDRRADVYSLGVSLYEALTLEKPFDHAARTALYRAIQSDPVPDPRRKNPALSEDVKVVLETALEKDRARRYPSTLELAEDLRRIREYEPIHARPASVTLKFARWTRRHPALAVAITGTILSLSIGLVVSLELLAGQRRALRLAVGPRLAQRAAALSVEDPAASVCLGIEGVERVERDEDGSARTPNEEARTSLLTALDSCWLMDTIGDPLSPVTVEAVAASPASDLVAVAFRDPKLETVSLGIASLETRDDPPLLAMEGGRIVELQFDARGVRLLCAGASGHVEVRDARSSAVLAAADLGSPIAHAEFAPDGQSVLVLGPRLGARLFAAATLQERERLACADDEFTTARFAPDGASILAWRPGSAPVAFAVADGARRFTASTGGGARDARFSGDASGMHVLLLGVDGALHTLDALTGAELGPTLRLPGQATSIAESGDGVHVAVVANQGAEGAVYLCDLRAQSVTPLGEVAGRAVSQVAFSPDHTRIAVATRDPRLRVYDVERGVLLREFRAPRSQFDLAWSADGERLITRPAGGGTAQVWFARVRPDVFDLEGHSAAIRSVAFGPDGTRVLTASADGTARLWNADPRSAAGLGREIGRCEHPGPLQSARASRDGGVVLTVGEGREARTWSASDGAPLRGFAQHPSSLIRADLDPAGERFVTLCADGRVRLWPARSDATPLVLAEGVTGAGAVAFSPDGRRVALSDASDVIRLFDTQTGALARELAYERPASDRQSPGVVALAFRPGCDELAAAFRDMHLRWFSVEDGVRLPRDTQAFEFRDLSFSRDGTRVLLAGPWGGGAVRSLSLVDGKTRFPDRSHLDDVTSASYSEDGALVLTTSKDGTARAWLAADGTLLVRRVGFASAVTCGDVSNALGEARAVTGCADGRVSVWPIDPLPAALSRKLPPLSPQEIRRESELLKPLEYP